MKILVTGGNGFIGKPTVRSISGRGHEVLSPSRPYASSSDARDSLDLLDANAVNSYLSHHQPDGLIHLAWDTTPGAYWISSANLTWTAASLRLLESFVRHGGKRAVIAGTSAEYSWSGDSPLSETDTPLAPDSLYGVSKDSLRRILEAWAPAAGISLAWGRVFCPYGPREKSSRLIPKLITRLEAGETLPFDSGNLTRDFLHVDELGSAFATLFESNFEGTVNLASGEDLTIREVATQLGDYLNRSNQIQFDQLPDPEGQPPRVVASTKRLSSEIGWKPFKSNKERLKETCLWWREHLAASHSN
ncbi:MAG: NAD-dependent epimerase/dehydratase family protein [Verrucomicrobiales bacterium]